MSLSIFVNGLPGGKEKRYNHMARCWVLKLKEKTFVHRLFVYRMSNFNNQL